MLHLYWDGPGNYLLLRKCWLRDPLRMLWVPPADGGRVGVRSARWNDDGDVRRGPYRDRLYRHDAGPDRLV
jgi:hypothetical protein